MKPLANMNLILINSMKYIIISKLYIKNQNTDIYISISLIGE